MNQTQKDLNTKTKNMVKSISEQETSTPEKAPEENPFRYNSHDQAFKKAIFC
ncbi:hypothetical protein FJ366_03755 [Candidatus Dependentiae bacterium]|nr:hypothetical protein [Candidatus Dependentiae bacterium]